MPAGRDGTAARPVPVAGAPEAPQAAHGAHPDAYAECAAAGQYAGAER
ncbi:hypothetical protein AB0O47_39870 [Streptomyces noursei]